MTLYLRFYVTIMFALMCIVLPGCELKTKGEKTKQSVQVNESMKYHIDGITNYMSAYREPETTEELADFNRSSQLFATKVVEKIIESAKHTDYTTPTVAELRALYQSEEDKEFRESLLASVDQYEAWLKKQNSSPTQEKTTE